MTIWDQEVQIERAREMQQELESIRQQQQRLLNHLLLEEIDAAKARFKGDG